MIASSIVRGILIGAKIVSSTVTLSKTATSQQSLNKIEGRHLGDIMSDEATQNPNFEILLFHNDKKIEIDLQKRGIEQTIPTHFLLEKILSVDRHCSSRWKYIPSGSKYKKIKIFAKYNIIIFLYFNKSCYCIHLDLDRNGL